MSEPLWTTATKETVAKAELEARHHCNSVCNVKKSDADKLNGNAYQPSCFSECEDIMTAYYVTMFNKNGN